jgi:hypothetical protein
VASGFVNALKQHAREVGKLEGAHADEFLELLKELQERLRGKLTGYGEQDAQLDVFKLRAVLAETEAGIAVLERKASAQFRAAVGDAAELSIEHTIEDIARLSRTFDYKLLNVSIDAAKVLADPAQGLLANHFESSVKKYGLDVLNGVRRELFLGLRTGETFGNVVASVTRSTGPVGGSKANAERLVRTETAQAYGTSQAKSLVEASKQVKGLTKVWLHIGSYVCPVCMPLHGSERPLDGTWTIKIGKKTRQVAHAPAHPHCVCRVSGMKPSWRNELLKLGYLDQGGKDASPAQL